MSTRAEIRSLSVVIPVYNSEPTVGALLDEIAALAGNFQTLEIVLVNDGSTDQSHREILAAQKRHPGLITYAVLSRNFGEHHAIMCGLNLARGQAAVIVADDFQNPPSEILPLVRALEEGYDVVYSHYAKKQHSWFRNFGSKANDLFATWLLRKPPGLYLSPFKALNRFLIDAVVAYKGPFPYPDGIILRSTSRIGRCLCQHGKRRSGKSHYTLARLWRVWMNMFTGFSIVPLRLAALIGFSMSLFSFVMAVYFVTVHFTGPLLIKQRIPRGWASTIVCVTFFAGLQLCVLGIVGEYLGRLFLTANRSPQYLIREIYGPQGRP